MQRPIPEDIWTLTISYLPVSDINRVRLVSKSVKVTEDTWKYLTTRDFPDTQHIDNTYHSAYKNKYRLIREVLKEYKFITATAFSLLYSCYKQGEVFDEIMKDMLDIKRSDDIVYKRISNIITLESIMSTGYSVDPEEEEKHNLDDVLYYLSNVKDNENLKEVLDVILYQPVTIFCKDNDTTIIPRTILYNIEKIQYILDDLEYYTCEALEEACDIDDRITMGRIYWDYIYPREVQF